MATNAELEKQIAALTEKLEQQAALMEKLTASPHVASDESQAKIAELETLVRGLQAELHDPRLASVKAIEKLQHNADAVIAQAREGQKRRGPYKWKFKIEGHATAKYFYTARGDRYAAIQYVNEVIGAEWRDGKMSVELVESPSMTEDLQPA